jgi:hypothetical protein
LRWRLSSSMMLLQWAPVECKCRAGYGGGNDHRATYNRARARCLHPPCRWGAGAICCCDQGTCDGRLPPERLCHATNSRCGRGVVSSSKIVNSLRRESEADLNSTPVRHVVSIRRTCRQMLRSRRTPLADRPPAPLDRREQSCDTQNIRSHSSRNSHLN